MFEVGQVCIKLAGRDSNNYCAVVKKIDDNFVLIEGNVRRRKCCIKHLQPQKLKLEIKDDASHEDVVKAFKKEGIEVKEKVGFKGIRESKKKVSVAKAETKVEEKKQEEISEKPKKAPAKKPKKAE